MSSLFDRRAEDSVMAALENKIVLRQIFCCLPLRDLKDRLTRCPDLRFLVTLLKECRLVKRLWNSEAVTFIRDFRLCNARISKDSPCSDLLALAEVVSGMKVIPIDSLSIELDEAGHSECKSIENQAKMLGTLLETLPLKHLHVSWKTAFRPLQCPVVSFVIDLLRRRIADLSTLEFAHLPDNFLTSFGQAWTPWLPKLKMLDMGDYFRLNLQKEFFLKILKAAPNLKKIKGRGFDSEILAFIPEDKYSCLENMWLSVECDWEETVCSKLALAAPEMSHLYLTAPHTESERKYMRSFVHILEKLFSSSRKSLKAFTMASPIFPLDLLSFPPLINVKSMSISTDDTTLPHLRHVLGSIDYPKLLPALYKLEVDVDMDFDPDDSDYIMNPWENRDAAELVQIRPSTSVKNLKISADFNSLTFKELSQMFPNVVYLDAVIRQPLDVGSSTSLSNLWEAWPHWESISITMHRGALRRNFDAEFLGISAEEIEILREFDDQSLEKMNIVPIRPSILTLLGLWKLKFGFYSSNVQAEVATGQFFLSKLTGILAFKKMARQGVKIQFVCKDAQAALRLNHLSPFVSLASKF